MDMVKPPFDEAFVVQNKEIPLKFVGNHNIGGSSNNRLNRNQTTSDHRPSGSNNHGSQNQYHTLGYDFKPASVNCDEPAQLELTSNGQVTIKAPNVGGSTSNYTLFRGQRRPHIKECLLIVDNRTGEVVLQKLTDNITVKFVLNGTSSATSGGNGNGNGSGNSNNSNGNVGPGSTSNNSVNNLSATTPGSTSTATQRSSSNQNSFNSQNNATQSNNSMTIRSNNSSQSNSQPIANRSSSKQKATTDGPQLSEESSSSSDSGSDDGDSDDDSGSSDSGSSSSSSSSSEGSNSGNSSPNDDGFKF